VLLFAVLALLVRTVVLLPMLTGKVGLEPRDRKLIALFGPRGLTSLLFALLPVFAGAQGGETIFAITSLVVLMSIVVHGGGMAVFLLRHAPRQAPAPAPAIPAPVDQPEPDRIGIAEVKELLARGAPLVMVDARAERSYEADPREARGAIRLDPSDPVRSATEQRLTQHATLVVYCA